MRSWLMHAVIPQSYSVVIYFAVHLRGYSLRVVPIQEKLICVHAKKYTSCVISDDEKVVETAIYTFTTDSGDPRGCLACD